MSGHIGDGRHRLSTGDEFTSSCSAFFPELEVFARKQHLHSYPVHVHDRWQLTWVLSGIVDLWHRGGSRVLHAGDAFLAAPFELVQGRANHGVPFGFVTLQIPAELLADWTCAHVVVRRNSTAICQSLITKLLLAGTGDAQHAVLDEMAALFLKPAVDNIVLTAERNRLHPTIRRACALLDDATEQKLPLTELAEMLRLNHRYVISLFKNVMGIPPHQYVMGRRIECARKLLNQGQPLISVAAETGFNDQSHLTHNFKRTFGVTPGAYQARYCHMNFLQNFPMSAA